jgi:hypothetical protein
LPGTADANVGIGSQIIEKDGKFILKICNNIIFILL